MAVGKPTPREYKENQWIRTGTWTLVDQRAGVRIAGDLTQSLRHNLSRRIETSLKADRIERARKVEESLMGHIHAGNMREALRNGRAGNTRGMKSEHLKQWLAMAES